MKMQSEEELLLVEHFCHDVVKYFGLVLVRWPITGRCKVAKHLDNGSLADCWFSWALDSSHLNEMAYPAIFSSMHEDLCPLLLGTDSSRDFSIQRFFWRDENGYDYSVENPFLGCKTVYEAKIKLDLMKG